jgi:hypothetical protein
MFIAPLFSYTRYNVNVSVEHTFSMLRAEDGTPESYDSLLDIYRNSRRHISDDSSLKLNF